MTVPSHGDVVRVLVNGRPGRALPVDDRGLLYGDGLFETIVFHHGRAALWTLHMARLADGCRRLGLPAPAIHGLADECRQVVGDDEHAVVRITLTRGAGGRAYVPPVDPAPNRIVALRDFPADLDRQRVDGIGMITAPFALPACDPLAGLKHLNRLPQVLIGAACRDAGVAEALVVDGDGLLVEALTGNLVIEREGALIAPGPHPAAVRGVGLAWLSEQAGATLRHRPFRRDALRSTDAIWVLNSVQGFRPVAHLDGEARPTGRMLRDWQKRWAELVES